MNKVNLEKWFQNDTFESALSFSDSREYRSILGVDEIRSRIINTYQEYKNEMSTLIKQNNSVMEEKYYKWETINKKKNICKLINFCFVVLLVMILFIGTSNLFLTLLFFAALFLAGVGSIVTIFFAIWTRYLREDYSHDVSLVGRKAEQINRKYEKDIYDMCKEIDELYLDMLEPADRIRELERRDKKQRHQELMHMKELELQQQKAIEEEQRKMRQVQEERLKIEREREERYKRNW